MRHYEVTFIIDPVLSDDERKSIVQFYADYLRKENCEIVHIDEMGLVPLAYTIAKRQSGYYICIEWQCEDPSFLVKYELALRRDERILRFLTVALDKFGVKYNEDKRAGKIGKKKKASKAKTAGESAPVAVAPEAAVEVVAEAVVEAPEAAVEVVAEAVVEAPEAVVEVVAEAVVEAPEAVATRDIIEEEVNVSSEDPELQKVLDNEDEA